MFFEKTAALFSINGRDVVVYGPQLSLVVCAHFKKNIKTYVQRKLKSLLFKDYFSNEEDIIRRQKYEGIN